MTHRVRLTLAIDGTPYGVRPIPRAELPAGTARGFLLTRSDARLGTVVHEVLEAFEGPTCSCGDQTFRQSPAGGACKHLAACRACGLL